MSCGVLYMMRDSSEGVRGNQAGLSHSPLRAAPLAPSLESRMVTQVMGLWYSSDRHDAYDAIAEHVMKMIRVVLAIQADGGVQIDLDVDVASIESYAISLNNALLKLS